MKLRYPGYYGMIALLFVASFWSQGLSAESMEKKFFRLFDGSSLEGWRVSTENPDSFKVEDGLLVAAGPRSHLFYEGPVAKAEFENFELRMQVKTTPGSNSGVFFHTRYQEQGWPRMGLEAQVNSTHIDPRRTGSIYGLAEVWWQGGEHKRATIEVLPDVSRFTLPESPTTDNEWFDYSIRVVGNLVTISIDGLRLVQWRDGAPKGDGGRRLNGGTFAIQAHDPKSVVYYRNIEVRILD